MRYLFFILLPFTTTCFAQSLTAVQQKALNNYVDYANQSAGEVTAVVKSIIAYYPSLYKKSTYGQPRYSCPVQLEDYYLNNSISQSKALPSAYQNTLNTNLHALRTAAEEIDKNCKALDTYHKLEDFKQDNFRGAETLVSALQDLVEDYKDKQNALRAELENIWKKLSATAPKGSYRTTDQLMEDNLARERAYLDSWVFNLQQEVHTNWDVDKLQQSILDTDAALKTLQQAKPVLKYPASSMWPGFQESLASLLMVKRNGLDGYNFEAKKTDEHSNDVYLSLINYYNGTLVSTQNAFIKYAEGDGYYGLKSINYFPRFTTKAKSEVVKVSATRFKDIPHVFPSLAKQTSAITPPTYEALSNYVDFINETWRQTRYLQMVLGSFSSSASSFRNLESFDRRGALSFDYKNFELPLSQYQATTVESKALIPAIAKTLNDQSTVLLNILKEMDDLCASLDVETREKKYEKDHLDRVYEILEREKVLFSLWDEKKEILYADIRNVYDAYPPALPASPWFVSGNALRNLTDLDHDGLFLAKSYYKGGKRVEVSTDKIDETLRDVIAREYDNMKDIRKLGRNNGLCPYTPYENLPVTSKTLSAALKELKPVSPGYSTTHPYHRMVYQYNEIVDDYNKFCSLSKEVLHLKTIHQPELFDVTYPPPKNASEAEPSKPVASVNVSPPPENTPVNQGENRPHVAENTENRPRAAENTKVFRDTLYIERHDTVYLSSPGENLRSMEGYASNNMILLLDVSGSMNTQEKLPLLKTSVLELLSMMRQEDQVSILAFSEKPKALLTAASFKEEGKIRKAINNLKSSGKTDGNAAVKLAYKVADENYIRGGNNRIILATDGEFSLSDDTRELIERFSKEDIFLSVFNFGKGMGASKALERLASLGRGNYEYITKENVEVKLISEAKAKRKK